MTIAPAAPAQQSERPPIARPVGRPGARPHAAERPALHAPGSDHLATSEVVALIDRAARALGSPTLTVAVVDRMGRVLGLYRRPNAPIANDDQAVGLARTAAIFSNDQAPLSSRTVRFISGIHFPPGIRDAPNAALYGIESTNRGCDLGAPFIPGNEVPQLKSVVFNAPCNSIDSSGCGPGVVTGKQGPFDSNPNAVDPGGVPVFKIAAGGGLLAVGGIGVTGVPGHHAEFAAFSAAFPTGVPALPAPGRVFIDGVRLPFVEQTGRPSGTSPGAGVSGLDLQIPSVDGGAAPDGYLVGPRAGSRLGKAEVERLVAQSIAVASRTRAVIRLPLGSRARMVIAVVDTNGELLALYRMPDSTVFSIDVAVAKARNVVYLSGPAPGARADLRGVPAGTVISSRTISFGAQPLFPPGIDGSGPGPFFPLFLDHRTRPCSQGSQPSQPYQSGVVFFPGSLPLHVGGQLVGALGISGDGVEQDDYVSFVGAAGFVPDQSRWADRVIVDGVRLPFLKFPRNPEQ